MITYFIRTACHWVRVTTTVAQWARLPHVVALVGCAVIVGGMPLRPAQAPAPSRLPPIVKTDMGGVGPVGDFIPPSGFWAPPDGGFGPIGAVIPVLPPSISPSASNSPTDPSVPQVPAPEPWSLALLASAVSAILIVKRSI